MGMRVHPQQRVCRISGQASPTNTDWIAKNHRAHPPLGADDGTYVPPSIHVLDPLDWDAPCWLWHRSSQRPPLPRPDPDATLDRIAAGVIRSKAKPLLQADQDPIRWKEYGDACLMNQWPEEAAVAYTQAIALGQPCGMHLAHAQRRLGNPEACQTASDSLQTNPVSERCVTLAHWYLEDGDLEQAEAWIRKADDLSSSRRAAVSMLLDIQRGELEAARTTLDPWLQGRVPSHLAQLAIQIGQATDDEALLQRLWRSESNQQVGAKWSTSPAASTLGPHQVR